MDTNGKPTFLFVCIRVHSWPIMFGRSPQQFEGALQLVARVRFAQARRDRDAHSLELPGLVETAQALQRLPAVVIPGGGLGMRVHEAFGFRGRGLEIFGAGVLHRQPIAREGVGRILSNQLFERLETIHACPPVAGFCSLYANIPAMACPYFFPTKRLAEAAWPKHPRLPLGDPYSGICRADPMHEQMPGVETLRECCNVGHAATRCSHFPKKHQGPDAIRYSVADDAADLIQL